ncbi:hypothetical protein SteCoe_8122 [Stentor coeruleus]|uniref:Cytosol aminopeptidase domain-containing protein n=1 Tax=Stentor coeruleus TaxID=5963 RepID=A0A1R2CL44_9CILI|nr:hypothetical protein SteCoe_8122 [Stentor coeruleus]
MLRCIVRRIHKALETSFNLSSETAVYITNKSSAEKIIKETALEDFKNTKAIWVYPKIGYKRALVLQVTKENEVFSSACNTISALKTRKITNADVFFPDKFKDDHVIKWVNTAILANYDYSLKTTKKQVPENDDNPDKNPTYIEKLNLSYKFSSGEENFNYSISSAINCLYARDLANTRGSIATPEFIHQKVLELVKTHENSIKIEVIEGKELQNQGLSLLYNVGKGAQIQPRLIILKYSGCSNNTNTLALVGKGITFDTGGLKLKSANSMKDMYLDKSGACAVLGAFKWAVENKIKINLICTLALAENAISSCSYKPLDILTSLKGKTVEIGNTDAEGRLCLADALTYTQQKYNPSTIIDLATLTGACVLALGEETAGAFGNNSELIEKLKKAGSFYQEKIWEMPINYEHEKAIEGKCADISNTGKSRFGGACNAAAFLKHFIEKKVNWVHLDINGPAKNKVTRRQFSAGGTGFGVQLLTRFMLDEQK